MKALAALLVVSFALTACTGTTGAPPSPAATLAPVTLSASIQTIDGFDDSTSVATSSAGSALPLFAIPGIATNYGTLNVLAWGTKDGAGNIQSLEEMAVYQNGSADVAYLFFDASGYLRSAVDKSTGYSVEFSSGSLTDVDWRSKFVATLCDSSLNAVATVHVAVDASGGFQGQAAAGGTCAPANPFSLTPASGPSLGAGVDTNLGDLTNLAQLITTNSSVAGFTFAIAALLKFQPQKPTISQLITLLFVGPAIGIIAIILTSVGTTIFGNEASLLGTSGVPSFMAPP